MPLRLTILGCGSSGGVPRVGGDWGVCDPQEPKNRRSRCSLLVEQWEGGNETPPSQKDRTIILIDTSPDLREQMLKNETQRVDALLFTHDHADQSHGIDDMRAIAYRARTRVPTYMDEFTKDNLFNRFRYCFETPKGLVHPPILELKPLLKPGDTLSIEGAGGAISIDVLGLSHGATPSLGFQVNKRAVYTPDVWEIEPEVLGTINQPDVWIVDSLRYNSHPTHANADKTLSWIAKTRTRKAILTNLHIDMDYNCLAAELPGKHEPAFDGMAVIL